MKINNKTLIIITKLAKNSFDIDMDGTFLSLSLRELREIFPVEKRADSFNLWLSQAKRKFGAFVFQFEDKSK